MATVSAIQSEKVLECGALESIFPCSGTKILDFLLTHREYDYSITDLAKFSGLSFKTALKEVNMLKRFGILKEPRNVGNAKMYRISKTSPLAQQINKIAIDIVIQDTNKNTSIKI